MIFDSPGSTIAAITQSYISTHPTVARIWGGIVIVAVVIEAIGALRHRSEATSGDKGSRIVIPLSVGLGVLLLVVFERNTSGADIRPQLAATIAGIVMFSLGEGLRVWSKVVLGRYFTYTVMTSSDQPVISTGPYRLLRHPSYSGFLLMAIGIGAVEGNWYGLASLTVMAVVGLGYRIRVEEKALLEELGDRYRSYAEHHKRLIPFVW